MTSVLNEDDIGELLALKYKMKSCLEHPKSQAHHYYDCMLEMEKIYTRLTSEGKKVPESDKYLVLSDMKLIASRFFDFLCEEIEKKERS